MADEFSSGVMQNCFPVLLFSTSHKANWSVASSSVHGSLVPTNAIDDKVFTFIAGQQNVEKFFHSKGLLNYDWLQVAFTPGDIKKVCNLKYEYLQIARC